MSATVLTLRNAPEERLDLAAVMPEKLAGLSDGDIEKLVIGTTKARLVLGDVFSLKRGDGDTLVIEGGSDRLDRIGAGMGAGEIRVAGDVGQCAGQAMQGGVLRIEGAAGPLAGSAMSGGRIAIGGDAGDFLGGPQPGEMAGMRGGEIFVGGNAGARAGDRLRRGTISIAGDADVLAGARMIAGTLVVGGKAAPGVGQLMKRGTIFLLGPEPELPTSFVDNGPCDLLFMRVLSRLLADLPQIPPLMRRFGGDMAVLGKGEVFIAAA